MIKRLEVVVLGRIIRHRAWKARRKFHHELCLGRKGTGRIVATTHRADLLANAVDRYVRFHNGPDDVEIVIRPRSTPDD